MEATVGRCVIDISGRGFFKFNSEGHYLFKKVQKVMNFLILNILWKALRLIQEQR